jgi:eukaryotic-like serine/threonine-protein kinase
MADRFSSIPSPNSLSGTVIRSDVQPNVTYRLERQIGEGGMGTAFLALRQAPDGVSPVVIKMVRSGFGTGPADAAAGMVVLKEAVALGRLNERVPPTPFVVRLVDTGSSEMHGPHRPPTPWLAVEYVHGGIEGTTLEDRVAYGIERTGFAFEAGRAAHLVRCLAAGMLAIHGVGVIHRDLTPGNILCCGFGEAEIFKVSDFGIARPQGLAATFGGVPVGTVGYAAPEQVMPDAVGVGTYTDVFSLACVIYFALTGQHYFEASTPISAMTLMRQKARKSLLDGKHLAPEIRQRTEACRAIDQLLARATAVESDRRPQEGQELAASLVPWLTETVTPPRPGRRLMNSLLNLAPPGDLSSWMWTVRHPPGGDRTVLSAAWDVDGKCLALTPDGPSFWDGQSWVEAKDVAANLPGGMRFVRRYEAGGWLVGGQNTLAVYATDGVREVHRAPQPDLTFLHASGRTDDLLAVVAERQGAPPLLFAMAARRWVRPMQLDGVSYVASLLRLEDARWLVCGRLTQGGGFVAVYSPLSWEFEYLQTPRTRAFVGGASEPERSLGLLVGSNGVALRVEGNQPTSSIADGEPDLTAGAMDVLDREWVASLGRLWVRDPQRDSAWRAVWSDSSWQAPLISIMADAGMVVALSADGGIVEGRAGWQRKHK